MNKYVKGSLIVGGVVAATAAIILYIRKKKQPEECIYIEAPKKPEGENQEIKMETNPVPVAESEYIRHSSAYKSDSSVDDIYDGIKRNEMYSGIEVEEVSHMSNDDSIEIIPPEDYGEEYDYEKLSYTYYADGVVADEDDRKVDNPESILGDGFETHFGEYEDDSVYVKNNKYKFYCELLADSREYEEVLEEKPYLRDD